MCLRTMVFIRATSVVKKWNRLKDGMDGAFIVYARIEAFTYFPSVIYAR